MYVTLFANKEKQFVCGVVQTSLIILSFTSFLKKPNEGGDLPKKFRSRGFHSMSFGGKKCCDSPSLSITFFSIHPLKMLTFTSAVLLLRRNIIETKIEKKTKNTGTVG